jgi:hypothetical protein
VPPPGGCGGTVRNSAGATRSSGVGFRDYREGTRFCPTFENAVTRHRMLDAIETAAATGQRQKRSVDP